MSMVNGAYAGYQFCMHNLTKYKYTASILSIIEVGSISGEMRVAYAYI